MNFYHILFPKFGMTSFGSKIDDKQFILSKCYFVSIYK